MRKFCSHLPFDPFISIGMGIVSSICVGGRSICVSDSLGILPGHNKTEVEDLAGVEKPSSGKLHNTESRDSGIVANEIPYNYTLPNTLINTEEEVEQITPAHTPKVEKHPSADDVSPEEERPSRPHSCRLGHRGTSQLVARKNREKLSNFKESKILNLVRSKKANKNRISNEFDANNNGNKADRLSSSSEDEDNVLLVKKVNTPRGSKRKQSARLKSGKSNKMSPQIVADLGISSEDSDADELLSIPDETSEASCEKDDSSYRTGWVLDDENEKNTEANSEEAQSTPIPSDTSVSETYKVVSSKNNVAKKASEMSISSIGLILTSTADDITAPSPTNSDCFEWLCDFPCDNDMVSDFPLHLH